MSINNTDAPVAITASIFPTLTIFFFQMELEGFGASLVGRTIYVFADGQHVWIPWEFISGTPYTCKILVTSLKSNYHCLEMEHPWTFIVRPQTAKDWSCIATILRGMGGSVLLTFDSGCLRPPDSFLTFLDSVVAEARIIVTRIWFGIGIEIPIVPDAIFFPAQIREHSQAAYSLIGRLPARLEHGPYRQMSSEEWLATIDVTTQSSLGLVISDVGEQEWKLFWHKTSDSVLEGKDVIFQKGFSWLRTAMTILEKNAE